ncbi:MAG: hydrogenase formation protein HypD [Candidatus Aminicenantes bacterium]|nr:hydrogenase formation protein HypD [Candidatus Aminicenantes bacterium]NIM77653.1 hydrogenase formation protein HypD [Candidatus Aminicenantes bacterium]NIN16965.1 hydrogenase formation protein HypD [Candidatus Aminicenantes bacterium]NIN40858.1 hydrogenase formation protein HypD [Candidatus Aminicenantes bacterium]NIN83662.1 hydrogenase formation protein HypD [Candidatus Aminicenantes bacterium]
MSDYDQDRYRKVDQELVDQLKAFAFDRLVKIMEVCGTHTVAIHRFGIQRLLPESVKLVSGPGCPVCVTPDTFIDEAVFLAREGFLIATFGDMIRVPGTHSSLEKERAQGHDIKIVYSPLDALRVAETSKRDVVFLSVGFETTIPGIAVTVMQAKERGIDNFFLLTANRLIPPAMTALIQEDSQLNGFILPGHVSTVLGKTGYDFMEALNVPGVISGFEPVDIVSSIIVLLRLIRETKAQVVNNYKRAVRDEGNPKSQSLINTVFAETDAEWRGIGVIPKSGLQLREKYAGLDIRNKIEIKTEGGKRPSGCRCGDVLKGRIDPPECPLFGSKCTPDSPIGPCMVSSEGSCSAWYKYG